MAGSAIRRPRNGALWEDQTYSDQRVAALHSRAASTRGRPAAIVVFLHGNEATLERDVRDRQGVAAPARRIRAQCRAGGAAIRRRRAGFQRRRFWEPGVFSQFLHEAAGASPSSTARRATEFVFERRAGDPGRPIAAATCRPPRPYATAAPARASAAWCCSTRSMASRTPSDLHRTSRFGLLRQRLWQVLEGRQRGLQQSASPARGRSPSKRRLAVADRAGQRRLRQCRRTRRARRLRHPGARRRSLGRCPVPDQRLSAWSRRG